jgi:hypothetical protein
MREENPSLPKSCKQGVQIKDQIPFLNLSTSLSIHLTFHKIGIWLSSNPSWITILLGDIGNQGMRHSPYLQTPHISLRSRERGSKLRPHVRIIHLEWLESTIGKLELLLKCLAKLQARNLNEQQKTVRWMFFSPATTQDQGMRTNTPHPPEP